MAHRNGLWKKNFVRSSLIWLALCISIPLLWGCEYGQTVTKSTITITEPTQVASGQTIQTTKTTETTALSLSGLLDVAQKVLTIAAIIVGAIWTYYNFFKGRIYKPRLEPKVSGTVVCNEEISYLLARVQLKNVGLSDITIEESGTALSVFTYHAASVTDAVSAREQKVAVFPIFKKHKWIEPSETIEEQRLVAIPGCAQHLAFRVELRLVSKIATLWIDRKRVVWNATCIITWQPTEDKEHQKPNGQKEGGNNER